MRAMRDQRHLPPIIYMTSDRLDARFQRPPLLPYPHKEPLKRPPQAFPTQLKATMPSTARQALRLVALDLLLGLNHLATAALFLRPDLLSP